MTRMQPPSTGIEALTNLGQIPNNNTFAATSRGHHLIFNIPAIPAGGEVTVPLVRQLLQNQMFTTTSRKATMWIAQAVGASPIRTPLARVADPSPAAGVGNTLPHESMVEINFEQPGGKAFDADLVLSNWAGDGRDPGFDIRDIVVLGNTTLTCIVKNKGPTVSIAGQIVLGGFLDPLPVKQ